MRRPDCTAAIKNDVLLFLKRRGRSRVFEASRRRDPLGRGPRSAGKQSRGTCAAIASRQNVIDAAEGPGSVLSPQRSNTRGWPPSRRRRWHPRGHGSSSCSSSAGGYGRRGTATTITTFSGRSIDDRR